MTKSLLTAKDITEMLRGHYLPEGRPPAGIFASEIGSPDGKRFADGLWQSTTRSGGLILEGHEIKISKADIAVELADASKAESWMQYCDKWWLVVADPALLDGFKIPSAWGVMAPPSGRRKRSMTIIKEAPLLNPVSKEPGLVRLMTWQTNKNLKEIQTLKVDNMDLRRSVQSHKDELAVARHGFHTNSYEMSLVVKIYEEIQKRMDANRGKEIWFGASNTQDIVDAVVDLREVRSRTEKLRRLARNILDFVERMDTSMKDVRKTAKEIGSLKDELDDKKII